MFRLHRAAVIWLHLKLTENTINKYIYVCVAHTRHIRPYIVYENIVRTISRSLGT